MTTAGNTDWRDVTRRNPCPICGKPDWCSRTADGAVCCRRESEPPSGWRRVLQCGDGATVFRPVDDRPSARHGNGRKTKKAEATTDWENEAAQFVAALDDERIAKLASTLGVTPKSVRAIDCGWNGWAFTFPERDADGRVIGIATRTPDGRKGFIKGGSRGLIVPHHHNGGTRPVFVVEGPTDVAALLALGLDVIGRPSNRAGVTELAPLLRYRDIVVVGENDRKDDGAWPGRDGAQSIAKGLATEWNRVVRWALPPGDTKDVRAWLGERSPDLGNRESLEAAGGELCDSLIAAAEEAQPDRTGMLHIRVDRTPGRAKSQVEVTFRGEQIAVERLDLSSSLKRSELAERLAHKMDLSADEVEKRLMAAATEQPAEAKTDPTALTRDELLAERDDQTACKLAAMPPKVVEEAEAMLNDPHLVDRIVEDFAHLGVVGERELALTTYVCGTARLLRSPLSGIVQGSTSSGKSHVISKIAKMFPPESVLLATDMTPQALFYLQEGRLIHTFVVAGERSRHQDDERAEATRALREMQSSGELSKVVTIKRGGRPEAVVIHQHGPIAYLESTTLTRIFDEDANRCLLLSTDESSDQTARVVSAIAERAVCDPVDTTPLHQRHRALQRLLRRVEVRIPFAVQLAPAIPKERPEARRAISHTLDMIRAIALLHQRQRAGGDVEHGDLIQATIDDYVVARRLLAGPLGRSLGGALARAVADLGHRLTEHFGGDAFSTPEAVSADPIINSRGKMAEHLRTLADSGVVELVERGRGNRPHTWRIIGEIPVGGAMWLPTVDELEGAPCATA